MQVDVASLDGYLTQIQMAAAQVYVSLIPAANRILGLLFVLSLAIWGLRYLIQRDDPAMLIGELVKRVFFAGVMVYFITYGYSYIIDMVQSFVNYSWTAVQAAGLTSVTKITPSSVISVGVEYGGKMWSAANEWSFLSAPVAIFAGLLAGALVVASFAYAGLMFAIFWLEVYLAVAASVLMFGLSVFPMFRDSAKNVLAFAFAASIKLFVGVAMIAFTVQISTNILNNVAIDKDQALAAAIMFISVAIMLYLGISNVGNIATSLTTGAVSFGAQNIVGPAASAIAGAAAGAGFMAKMGGGQLGESLLNKGLGGINGIAGRLGMGSKAPAASALAGAAGAAAGSAMAGAAGSAAGSAAANTSSVASKMASAGGKVVDQTVKTASKAGAGGAAESARGGGGSTPQKPATSKAEISGGKDKKPAPSGFGNRMRRPVQTREQQVQAQVRDLDD